MGSAGYSACRVSEPGIRVGWRDLGRLMAGETAFSWLMEDRLHAEAWQIHSPCSAEERSRCFENVMPLFTVVRKCVQ